MLGQTLVDRYRIDAELGHGGMGVVYRGFDLLLARPVAIKMISSSNLGNEARTRLLAEARAVARLNHPNIVTVYDAIESEGTPCIVMELVEGGTLRSIPFPGVRQSIEYARQLSAALVHAHARGIIHRDIKPDNVLISPGGLVKLNDFGLARRMDTPRVTDAGLLIGTFAYLAPELIQGDDPSPQSDLYALGVLLYELLTGDLPFKGNDIAHLFAALLRGEVPSPKTHNPDIPDLLNTLVMQLLSRKPQDRPESAQVVEATLTIMQSDWVQPQVFSANSQKTQALGDSADSRARGRGRARTGAIARTGTIGSKDLEKDWRRKSYPKSSVPVLGPGEKEQIFSNRQKELAASSFQLNDHRLLVITGMPGIGKSTLARALLEFMPMDTPPPFWYDFERQKSSGNTLGVLLDRISAYLDRVLGGSVRDEIMAFRDKDQQASVHDVDMLIDFLNQDISLWLVFDNLEAALSKGGNGFLDKNLEILFDGLKNSSHRARVVITSPLVPILQGGEFLLESGSQPLTLQGLDQTASINCLRANGLQDYQDDVLAPITRLVDGHPFALKHVARYIVTMGVQAALDNLEGGLDGFLEHFQATLLQRLSEEEYQALQHLTVLQRDISMDGLCKVAQARPAMIGRLKEAGLLESNISGGFWLPSLIRASLRRSDLPDMRPCHMRALEFYRKQKRPIIARQIDDYASALEWHYHAIQGGEVGSAFAAIFSTGACLSLKSWNEFALLRGLCEDILAGLEQTPEAITRLEMVSLLLALGDAYFIQRNIGASITVNQRALQVLSGDDDAHTRARVLVRLGDALRFDNQNSAAIDCSRQVLEMLATKPDGLLKAQALQLQGEACVGLGEFDRAIESLEASRATFEALANSQGVAFTTMEIGVAYSYQNQFELALENFHRSVVACQEISDEYGVMMGHWNLGDLFLQLGRFEEARQELEQAVELAHKKKFTGNELTAGLYLAETNIALNRLDDAQGVLDGLAALLTESQNPVYLGHAMRLRAGLAWRQGQLVEANKYFSQVFELLKGEAGQYERARAQLEFGAYLRKIGKLGSARTALLEARRDFEALNSQPGLRLAESALHEVDE